MKKCFLFTQFVIFLLPIFGQDNPIKKPKYSEISRDTIEANFLIEVNSDSRFYSTNDVIFQNNLVLIDFTNTNNKNSKALYFGDSIFIYYWDEGARYFNNKTSINIKSIRDFWLKTQYTGGNRKDRKNRKKSIFKNNEGVLFLRFHATIIVLNLGKMEWNIPWIYCDESDIKNQGVYKYCKRSFPNTLIFTDVLDFKYLKLRNKLKH